MTFYSWDGYLWSETPKVLRNFQPYLTKENDNIACWQFNSGLTDLVNSIALASTDSSTYLINEQGALGIVSDGYIRYETSDTRLRILGDVTVEMICRVNMIGTNLVLAEWKGGTSTSNQNANYVYSIGITSQTCLKGGWQYGSGTTVSSTAIYGPSIFFGLSYIAMTRSGTTINLYLNNRLVKSENLLSLPDGGDAATGRFSLLGGLSGGLLKGEVFSVAVTNSARSAAHLLSRYESSLGAFY